MHCRRSSFGQLPPGSVHQQRGAALVVAMLVFALCTALVVAMKSEFDRFYQRSANTLLREQAQAYLRGAEELAAMVLIRDYDADKERGTPRDDLLETWAQDDPPPTYAIENIGWMSGVLVDLQGRFNLNLLATHAPQGPGKPRFTPEQAQFIRLLQALEEPPVSRQEAILITESVSDWLDADQNPSRDGVEDDYYYSRTPAYRTGNRPMASASEIRSVAYMTPQIYQALLPFITVWPQDPVANPAPLNIHTASAMVLRSLNADANLSPLSDVEGQSLLEYRESSGFLDVKDFLANPVFDGKVAKMNGTRDLLGVSSAYFLLRAEVEVADRNMRLYSVLQRHDRRIEALARASGSL